MTSPEVVVTPEMIASAVTIAISLLFTYFPWLRTWFAPKPTEIKSLIMIGLALLVSAFVFLAGCEGWITTNIVCTQSGLIELVKIFFISLAANQVTYLSTKSLQPKSVVELKDSRNAVG